MISKAQKEQINERRAQVAELSLRGLCIDEIARSVSVGGNTFDRSTIKRDLEFIRKSQRSWYASNAKIALRFTQYFKHELDSIRNGQKRTWEQYDKANEKDQGSIAVRAMRVLAEFIKQECELLGLTGGNLNEIEGRENLERLEKTLEEHPELKKLLAANNEKKD